MLLQVTPRECLHIMNSALKPSLSQLHLESLYFEGRRYYLEPDGENGFKLMNTSRHRFRYRQRTGIAAMGFGTLTEISSNVTEIQVRFRVRIFPFLRALLIPAFMTSIIVYMPWPPAIIALLIVVLFGLSLLDRWLQAVLQANEIAHFIEITLRDYAAEIPTFAGYDTQVVTQTGEFARMFERFYEEHAGEQE